MSHRVYLRKLILNSIITFAILIFSRNNCIGQTEDDPFPLFFLQNNLTRVLVNDNISPPVASRNYVYPNLASNYILSKEGSHRNIFSKIDYFPKLIISEKSKYSKSLAASFAFYTIARKLIYTEKPFTDSFKVLLNWYKKYIDISLFKSSKLVGIGIAKQVINWMSKDNFLESRKMNKYILIKSPDKWQPTPPGYFAAVEPHWGILRTLATSKIKDLDKKHSVQYDTSIQSEYNKEAKEVYIIHQNLTDEQKQIADFWDCNPFALNNSGHIQTFIKKISPGAHWLNIAIIACKQNHLNLENTSNVITLCAISIYDSFIHTWKLKYKYNNVRPETYIQNIGMSEVWKPYIQCPPFPEFPSGHAVISNAAAIILTHYFGENYNFRDDSEVLFGQKIRIFNSFKEAALEASISRVYGGIHFRSSCNIGNEIGTRIGNFILSK